MPSKIGTEDAQVLRFGGGINSRASEDRIDPLECTDGQNFLLDAGTGEFRKRPPFDLVGTVPNAAEVRGFVTLLKSDGTVKMAVQAGATVYDWDGANTFTSIGTVAATAKLRGAKEAIFQLDDKVIITDLNLAEEVHEWNGTTFQQTSFLASDGSTAFATFRAKYCVVENERAYFGNVHDNGTNIPHLLVCSQRGQFEVIIATGQASTDRAGAAGMTAEDPWFLPMPQFKPINGLVFAMSVLAVSQQKGAFDYLTGVDATDFALTKLHDGSGASGFESTVSITNDIVYGVSGAIESLQSTDKFGNVEFDDLSFKIAPSTASATRPSIRSYTGWTLVYNSRLRRVYCFPDGQQECWVLFTDFIGTELSPWSKWVTKHALAFQPTAVMTCRDPSDGLEYVFMGDASGNVYRMEGSGTSGDGGTHSIRAFRTSMLYSAPLDSKAQRLQGWIQHRKNLANTAELTVLWAGEHVFDEMISREFSALTFGTPYGGSVYYGGAFYYGVAQENRLVRQQWTAPGRSNQFQLKTQVDGFNDFAWTETGVRYEATS